MYEIVGNDIISNIDILGLLGSEKTCENTGEHELRQVAGDRWSFYFACYCKQTCSNYCPVRGGVGPGGGMTYTDEEVQAWKSEKPTYYTQNHDKAAKKAVTDALKKLAGKAFTGPSYPYFPEPQSEEEERRESDEWTMSNNQTWDEMKEKCSSSCSKS